uniref:Secreted protein n=1 Tax=Romanomermis culicivorax TaxID=13658 RepID=A0A915INS9_ROMCU
MTVSLPLLAVLLCQCTTITERASLKLIVEINRQQLIEFRIFVKKLTFTAVIHKVDRFLQFQRIFLQHYMSKHLFSNYLSSVQEVRAEANSDSSHGHSLCKSDEENEHIDEVVIWED